MALELNHEVFGQGPPLVVLHGLFGSARSWGSLARGALGARFEVHALDLRNHGASPHASPHDYAAMAGDVAGYLDARTGGRARVLGHSMGGKVAMELALGAAQRVEHLVVVDIAPRAYAPHLGEVIAALEGLDLRAHRSRQALDAALAGQVADPTLRAFLLTNVTRGEGGGFVWRINLALLAASQEAIGADVRAGRFDGPALFIRGERSGYVRDEDMVEIRSRFPRAELVTIEGAGHWVHADAPEALSRAVIEALGASR